MWWHQAPVEISSRGADSPNKWHTPSDNWHSAVNYEGELNLINCNIYTWEEKFHYTFSTSISNSCISLSLSCSQRVNSCWSLSFPFRALNFSFDSSCLVKRLKPKLGWGFGGSGLDWDPESDLWVAPILQVKKINKH